MRFTIHYKSTGEFAGSFMSGTIGLWELIKVYLSMMQDKTIYDIQVKRITKG